MRYRWVLAPQGGVVDRASSDRRGLPKAFVQCLELRGLTEPGDVARFLDPRLRDLTDPFDFPAMRPMVDRLVRARRARERVLLFGDYDVDGVTATALLHEVLSTLGWDVACYLPDRFTDGYGLTPASVGRCLQEHPASLLLAVDCGANASGLIAELAGQGTEVLVLDHHDPGQEGWPATPCLHPLTLPGTDHPARGLCSVGCAFKLAHALVKEGREQGREAERQFDVRSLLDLVALGTVADLVPLRGENRVFVAKGIDTLGLARRPGLRALMAVAGVGEPMGAYEIGFQLAPRLNAAGRLETARPAWDLLRTDDEDEARRLAELLDARNRERQALDRATSEAVIRRLDDRFDPENDRVVVEGDPGWHLGVLGIVAARVARDYQRPALILGGGGEVLRGSGRSVDGFDLAQALGQCADILESGGGHAMAAGLSVRPDRLDDLRERLNALAGEQIPAEGFLPQLVVDLEVSLDLLTLEFLQWLRRLEPTGQGNPRPRFLVRALRQVGRPQVMGKQRQHLRLMVTDGAVSLPTVWWGGAALPWPEGIFDAVVEPGLNCYQGRTSVQLQLVDWRPSEG